MVRNVIFIFLKIFICCEGIFVYCICDIGFLIFCYMLFEYVGFIFYGDDFYLVEGIFNIVNFGVI